MNKLTILEMFDFYRDVPAGIQTKIEAASTYAKLASQTVIFLEGGPCRHLVAVGAGTVQTFKIAASGREITLFRAGDGLMSPVNIVSVLFDRPAIASARVDTPVEAVLIPSPAVREWVTASDPIRTSLMEAMATGLAEVTSLVGVVAFRTMDSRLTDLLLQRFAGGRAIFATHEDIAAELGTTREVVSRLLKGYERMGAIMIFRGRLELRDASMLHHRA